MASTMYTYAFLEFLFRCCTVPVFRIFQYPWTNSGYCKEQRSGVLSNIFVTWGRIWHFISQWKLHCNEHRQDLWNNKLFDFSIKQNINNLVTMRWVAGRLWSCAVTLYTSLNPKPPTWWFWNEIMCTNWYHLGHIIWYHCKMASFCTLTPTG